MNRPDPAPPPRPAPRLYLVTPAIADGDAFAPMLEAALHGADVAAALLRFESCAESAFVKRAKTLVRIVQRADAAALLDDHPGFAARSGADGAHLTGLASFTDAVGSLKPERIAGIGGLSTRHDAMVAAEAGADYVLFGAAGPGDRKPDFGTTLERIGWWAEVFETPCVGLAHGPDEIAPLAAAGADFVALGDWIWSDPRGATAAIAAAMPLLAAEPAL